MMDMFGGIFGDATREVQVVGLTRIGDKTALQVSWKISEGDADRIRVLLQQLLGEPTYQRVVSAESILQAGTIVEESAVRAGEADG
jgi:hypothetical protein